jgi:hypothetical protein
MIVIGHKDIEYKPFFNISKKEDVDKTPPNSTLILDYDSNICKFLEKNSLNFAIKVKDQLEVILASNLGASFIVCNHSLAKDAQKFADSYLFDAKILVLIDSEDEIVEVAKDEIDGVIFKEAILDGSC